MKNLLYIVIVAAISLFTASAPKETVLPSAPSGAFARIESGRTLAVQNGFTVSFSGEDGFIKQLELRSPYVIRPGRCVFSRRFVFMPDKCFGIIRRGDVWQPSGCAVFDRSGNVVREFSAAKSAFGESRPDGEEYFRADAAFFIDESTLAVKTPGGIFIYSVTGNTTVLKKCGGEKGARPPEKPDCGESSGGRKGAGREKPPAEHGNFGVSFENSCGEPKIGHGVPFEGFGALGGGGGSVCK